MYTATLPKRIKRIILDDGTVLDGPFFLERGTVTTGFSVVPPEKGDWGRTIAFAEIRMPSKEYYKF